MPSITLKQIPENLHHHYKRQAKKHARSLQGEILEVLRQQAKLEPNCDKDEVRVEDLAAILKPKIDQPLSDEQIQERLAHDAQTRWPLTQ